MANMSYCRFGNTLSDLHDCLDAMEDAPNLADMDLSENEQGSMDAMAKACKQFLSEHNRLRNNR